MRFCDGGDFLSGAAWQGRGGDPGRAIRFCPRAGEGLAVADPLPHCRAGPTPYYCRPRHDCSSRFKFKPHSIVPPPPHCSLVVSLLSELPHRSASREQQQYGKAKRFRTMMPQPI
ncbi:unnamed protein product [Calypogeia fissa]